MHRQFLNRATPQHFVWLRVIRLLVVTCALTLVTGCASRTAYVIARQNAEYQLGHTSKITLADHAHPREAEQALREDLLTQLPLQGFELVAPDQAEYALAYWIDKSWRRGKVVVSNRQGYWLNPTIEPGPPFLLPSSPYLGTPSFTYSGQPQLGIQHVVEVAYATQGIQLKLYHLESMRSGRMQTAWDGYIEAGDRVTKEREPLLLSTLLKYVGKDFVGRAKLVE